MGSFGGKFSKEDKITLRIVLHHQGVLKTAKCGLSARVLDIPYVTGTMIGHSFPYSEKLNELEPRMRL